MFLSAEQILSCDDAAPAVVSVPEWGGNVLVRGLDGLEQTAYARKYLTAEDEKSGFVPPKYRAALIALCLVDEERRQLFSAEQIDALARKSGAAISRVYAVCARKSGFASGAVDDAKKN